MGPLAEPGSAVPQTHTDFAASYSRRLYPPPPRPVKPEGPRSFGSREPADGERDEDDCEGGHDRVSVAIESVWPNNATVDGKRARAAGGMFCAARPPGAAVRPHM